MQDNTHSKHVFEKLGAVYIDNETAPKKTTINRIKEIMPESDISELEIRNVLVYHL